MTIDQLLRGRDVLLGWLLVLVAWTWIAIECSPVTYTKASWKTEPMPVDLPREELMRLTPAQLRGYVPSDVVPLQTMPGRLL